MDAVASQKQHLNKAISFSGFLGMGIGCVFGASWLIMSGVWLDKAGGPINLILAFLLCLVVEMPLALAYLEAVPMIPLAGGEMAYSYLAFGGFAGLIAGWFGVLVNIILCAWESVAMISMLGYLLPSIKTTAPLYKVGEFTVTLPTIFIGLAIIIGIGILNYKGVKLSSRFQTINTSIVLGLVIIATIAALFKFNPANLQPATVKPMGNGVLALLAMLPFSVAGWETIAKGAEEATAGLDRAKVGQALVISIIVAIFMYIVTSFVPAGIIPWQNMAAADIPFATAVTEAMGTPLFGIVLTIAACFGVIGVYNACFYGATRLLYSLADVGLVPAAFAKLHPKHKTPVVAIIFVSVLAAIAPFIGKPALIPLIDVAAFAYIILWGSTLLSVMRLRKTKPHLQRPAKMPGGMFIGYFGVIVGILLLIAMLFPGSPAALQWPAEYLLLLVLIVLGGVFYTMRDKSVSEEERAKMILGSISDEV